MNYEKQIDHIMENFDFPEVHRVMVLMDWQWPGKTPTLEEVRVGGLRVLRMLTDGSTHSSCGGFEAINLNNVLHLFFSITEWDGGLVAQ